MPEVFAELKAIISDFQEKMAEARGEMEETEHSGSSSFLGLGSVASGGLAAVGAAVVAAGALAVDLGIKFQASTASMAAAGSIPIKTAQQIGNAFLKVGGDTIYSGAQMEQAYGAVAGRLALLQGHTLNATQATQFMKTAMDFAEESGTNLNTATSSLSAVMLAFGINTGHASDAATILYNTGAKTGNSVDTIATTVDKLHMKLGDLTPSLAQTGGLLVTLAENGVSGTRGMNTMSTSLTKLLGGTKPVNTELAALGVSLYNSQGQFVGLGPVMDAIGEKLVNMTQKQQIAATTTLFGASSASVMNNVLSYGSLQLDQNTKAVQSTTTAHAALAAQQKTVEHEVDALKVQLEDMATRIGIALIPTLSKLLRGFSDVMTFLSNHQQVIKDLATVLFYVLGGAVLQLGLHWNAVWSGMKTAVNDFVGFFVAIPGEIVGFFSGVANRIYNTFIQPLISFMTAVPNEITNLFANVGNGIVGFFTAIPGEIWNQVILPIWNFFVTLPGSIVRLFVNLGPDILHAIEADLPGGGILKSVISHLAEGGLVTKPTLAVVGEAGPELVIPMSTLQGAAIDSSGITSGISAGGAGGGTAGVGGGDLVLQIDGQTFARLAGPAFRQWLNTAAGRNGVRLLVS